jgi:hypothetical protein
LRASTDLVEPTRSATRVRVVLRHPQLDLQRHQPLLRTVGQIALEFAPLPVSGLDDPDLGLDRLLRCSPPLVNDRRETRDQRGEHDAQLQVQGIRDSGNVEQNECLLRGSVTLPKTRLASAFRLKAETGVASAASIAGPTSPRS